jgi:hypothetical protein
MNQADLIYFSAFGLKLQEPMSLVFNILMAFLSFIAYFSLKDDKSEEIKYWKLFFLFFGLSTFVGGFGHLFFQYFGVYGKFPHWIGGVISAYFAGKAMLCHLENIKLKKVLGQILIVKAVAFLGLSLMLQNFIFVAVDAIATYFFYCGIIGFNLMKKGIYAMKYIVLGVLICIPAAFVYILKINPGRWFNTDDLSHVFMFACVFFFYLGANSLAKEAEELEMA